MQLLTDDSSACAEIHETLNLAIMISVPQGLDLVVLKELVFTSHAQGLKGAAAHQTKLHEIPQL